MKKKKRKIKTHRVSMSREEMIFALFAFRKAHAHEHFTAVRMRLNMALANMGLYAYGGEFDLATEQYENLFEPVPEYVSYIDTI